MFGVGAKYIDHLKNENFDASEFDLSNLKIITSTGSPLVAESFEYVYKNIKDDVHLSSISGGTDVVGCLVIGNIFQPVYAGEIQGPSLESKLIFMTSKAILFLMMKRGIGSKKPFHQCLQSFR